MALIPYSLNISREKIFTDFEDLWIALTLKILSCITILYYLSLQSTKYLSQKGSKPWIQNILTQNILAIRYNTYVSNIQGICTHRDVILHLSLPVQSLLSVSSLLILVYWSVHWQTNCHHHHLSWICLCCLYFLVYSLPLAAYTCIDNINSSTTQYELPPQLSQAVHWVVV